MADSEVAALARDAVHPPFAAVWHGYAADWGEVRGALRAAAAAHADALARLEGALETDGESAGRVLAVYRGQVATHLLTPLREALSAAPGAVALAAKLKAAEVEARSAATQLPESLPAPISGDALTASRGLGVGVAARRTVARLLRPLIWRSGTREVPAARLARKHLDLDVLPTRDRVFGEACRAAAAWIGRVERLSTEWSRAVLLPPERIGAARLWDSSDGTAAFLEAARRMQEGLEALDGGADEVMAAAVAAAGMEAEAHTLAKAVAVEGTLVARGSGRRRRSRWLRREMAAKWDRWGAEAAARLELHLSVLSLRAVAERLLGRLATERRNVAGAAAAEMEGAEAALVEAVARAEALPEDTDDLEGRIAAARERTLDRLGRSVDRAEGLERRGVALTTSAGEAVRELEAACLALPELAVHSLPRRGKPMRRPGRPARTVHWRDFAVQTFNALRIERIRTSPTALAEALAEVRSELSEALQVATYGLDAALDELSSSPEAAARPLALARDALASAADKLGRARGTPGEGERSSAATAAAETMDGMDHVALRATSHDPAARQLDAARSFLAGEAARHWVRLRGQIGGALRRLARATGRQLSRVRSVAARMGVGPQSAQRGPAPAGSPPTSAAELLHTLPIVYQRLFAFEPVTDEQFLAGRDRELDEMQAAWALWRGGGGSVLLVVAEPGVGATSFLNIALRRIAEDGGDLRRVELRDRIRDESALAHRVASWLGVDEAGSLDAIAGRGPGNRRDRAPPVVLVEGAEHLAIRAPGGVRLARRFLEFAARGLPGAFWVVSIGWSAWQLMRTRAPELAAFLPILSLSPLAPAELRSAVRSRHRRSGLPLRYLEPRTGAARLRLRVRRRAGRSARHQELIERDYFERLRRLCGGSVRLALLYWLRSADFATEEGRVLVRPLEPLGARTDGLSRDQGFALKAVLDHGSVTAEEYAEIVRVRPSDGEHTLKALAAGRFVVEMAASTGGDPVRYAIDRLMVGPVVEHLRSHNILHR